MLDLSKFEITGGTDGVRDWVWMNHTCGWSSSYIDRDTLLLSDLVEIAQHHADEGCPKPKRKKR